MSSLKLTLTEIILELYQPFINSNKIINPTELISFVSSENILHISIL